MELDLLAAFLPDTFLEHFNIVSYQLLGIVETKKMEFEIHLDEQNILPEGYEESDYESKGFLPSSRVQDFPIRGKAVYLIIRRRRWRHKQSKKGISTDYSFISEGSRITEELSAFLKSTGRDPRRYN